MPPTAPVEISRDGKQLKFPPFLEDIEIELEVRRVVGGSCRCMQLELGPSLKLAS